jgi:hypothetical protein
MNAITLFVIALLLTILECVYLILNGFSDAFCFNAYNQARLVSLLCCSCSCSLLTTLKFMITGASSSSSSMGMRDNALASPFVAPFLYLISSSNMLSLLSNLSRRVAGSLVDSKFLSFCSRVKQVPKNITTVS